MFNSFLVKYVAIFFVIMDVLYIVFGHFMLIPMEDIFMGKSVEELHQLILKLRGETFNALLWRPYYNTKFFFTNNFPQSKVST